MPSLQDSVVIFILALILVGPKNLPKLARQLGKLMAEFRRASNEFRMQMEDELRVEEQKERDAKLAASTPATTETITSATEAGEDTATQAEAIAESGSLKMMPPSTGLPVAQDGYASEFSNTEETAHAENTVHDAGTSSEEPIEEIHSMATSDEDAYERRD